MDARNLTDWAKDLRVRTAEHDRIRVLERRVIELEWELGDALESLEGAERLAAWAEPF